MTDKPSLQQLNTILSHGHAHEKHVLGNDPGSIHNGKNQFRISQTGPDLHIETKQDLANYMKDFFSKEGTRGFKDPQSGVYYFYNNKDNVFIAFNPADKDLGTIYRPDNFKNRFEDVLKNARSAAPRVGNKVEYFNTPEDIHKLTQNLEKDFGSHPRAARIIERRSAELGIDSTLGRKPPAPASVLSDADSKLAESIKNADKGEAFFDAKSGSKFFLSEDKKTMMMLDSSGAMRLYKDNADEAFMLAFKHVSETNGKMPDIINGGMKALAESAEKGGLAARFLGKYADDAADIAKLAGKLSKVLPAVGAVAVAVEIYQFLHKAGDATRMGVISAEAFNEYKALCTGSGATGLGGFITSTAGEAAAMAAFDLWAKKNNVPDYLRKELQPDGLVRMAKDAAEKYVLPGGSHTKASAQTPFAPKTYEEASAPFKPGASDDYIAMGNTRSFKTDDFDLSPSNHEAAVCFTPEIEMLVESTKMVKQADRELSQASPALGNISNASLKMSLAGGKLAEAIKELADNGGLKEVIDFSNDSYKNAIKKPRETESPLEQSMGLQSEDMRLAVTAAAKTLKF